MKVFTKILLFIVTHISIKSSISFRKHLPFIAKPYLTGVFSSLTEKRHNLNWCFISNSRYVQKKRYSIGKNTFEWIFHLIFEFGSYAENKKVYLPYQPRARGCIPLLKEKNALNHSWKLSWQCFFLTFTELLRLVWA